MDCVKQTSEGCETARRGFGRRGLCDGKSGVSLHIWRQETGAALIADSVIFIRVCEHGGTDRSLYRVAMGVSSAQGCHHD